MVCFDPLVFVFLVTGWRTFVEFGFYQSSTLFEGNKSGKEVRVMDQLGGLSNQAGSAGG